MSAWFLDSKLSTCSGTNISRNTEMIPFNFHMLSSVYVRQEIYKFSRNQVRSYVVIEIQMVKYIWYQ